MARPVTEPMISLPSRAHRDLAIVAANRDHLGEIGRVASQAKPAESIEPIIDHISKQLDIPRKIIHRIVTTISNLRTIQEKLELSSEGIFDSITADLEQNAEAEWKKQNLEKWNESRDAVVALFDQLAEDHPLTISTKARHLTFAHEHVLTDVELITDVRPVFDKTAGTILEAIISHTLIVRFADDGELNSMYFALDAEDVAKLRRLCDRADRKALTIRDALHDTWPTKIIGDGEDG